MRSAPSSVSRHGCAWSPPTEPRNARAHSRPSPARTAGSSDPAGVAGRTPRGRPPGRRPSRCTSRPTGLAGEWSSRDRAVNHLPCSRSSARARWSARPRAARSPGVSPWCRDGSGRGRRRRPGNPRAGRQRPARVQGDRLLRPARRRPPGGGHRAGRDPLPLGPPAAAGGRRRVAEPGHGPALRRLRGRGRDGARRPGPHLDHPERALVLGLPRLRVGVHAPGRTSPADAPPTW
jgi:hypothetical protein